MAEMFTKADAYEQLMGRWSRRLAPLFLDFCGVHDGARILDVGCGTGALTSALSERIGGAQLVGIDPSEAAIRHCRARYGGNAMAFDCGDAMQLPYAERTFDHSLSMLVFQFIPDPAKAVTQMRRVTRPGGIVGACTWDGMGLELGAIFWEEATRLDPAAESTGERPQKFRRPGELESLWRNAGLDGVRESVLEFETPFADFDDYWLPFNQGVGPYGLYTASISDDRKAALRDALRDRLARHTGNGAFTLRARALAVRGRAPN